MRLRVFDGVHEGHRFLIARACETAREGGGPSCVLTFDIDPDEVFHAERLKKLMDNDARIAMLADTGVDRVCVLPFTRTFAALSPQDFLQKTFGETRRHACTWGAISVSARAPRARWRNCRHGAARRACGWSARPRLGRRAAHHGHPHPAASGRRQGGRGERAARRPYAVGGEVRPGARRGWRFRVRHRQLHVPDQLRAIGDGVYAAWARVGEKRFKAAVNVGVPATFADRAEATCEVHLLDFEGDLYGKPLVVEFMHWLRPMRKFDSVEELVSTVEGNIAWVRENL